MNLNVFLQKTGRAGRAGKKTRKKTPENNSGNYFRKKLRKPTPEKKPGKELRLLTQQPPVLLQRRDIGEACVEALLF